MGRHDEQGEVAVCSESPAWEPQMNQTVGLGDGYQGDDRQHLVRPSADRRQSLRVSRVTKLLLCAAVTTVVAVGLVFGIRAAIGRTRYDSAPEAIRGESSGIMVERDNGTCEGPVEDPLRWGANREVADKICCHNRHYAEMRSSFGGSSFLTDEVSPSDGVIFYDSVTNKPLFRAPMGRSWEAFLSESRSHGWPSFRDEEVVMENVRVLEDGEVVSVDGTHLGHNLPDRSGNRYCINLVSVAGTGPTTDAPSQ